MLKQNILAKYLSDFSLLLLCLIMLQSMQIYFLWGRGAIALGIVGLFLMLRIPIFPKQSDSKKIRLCFTFMLLYVVVDMVHIEQLFTCFQFVIRHIFLFFVVIHLADSEKSRLLDLFTKIYASILLVSLLIYITVILGMNIPYSIFHPSWDTTYPPFRNYLFLLMRDELEFFPRFQSMFIEPGHVGMIAALLLYVNRYNLKNPFVFILLCGLVVSFSLAAYILFIFGVFIYYIIDGHNRLYRCLKSLLIIAMVAFASIMAYVSDPNSVYSKLIIERLDISEDRGFKGNNRTSKSFDGYYEHFFETSDCVFGIGNEFGETLNKNGGNSSYKTFIVQYGIVGILLLATFYLLYLKYHYSPFMLGMFLLYAASFWQRPYALWEAELFLFIGAPFYQMKQEAPSSLDKYYG